MAEGRPWTATAKISEHALCLSFVEAGTTQQFGCVPLANIRDADITFATGVSGTDRVGGSTEEEARFVEAVAGGVMSRLPVVSLRPLGLAAAAHGVLLPASPPTTEVRLLDEAGNVLVRGAP